MIYADDSQMYITCKRPSAVKSSIEACVDELRSWMKQHCLALNDEKIEVIKFSSKFGDVSVETFDTLRVGDSDISVFSSVKNLGVMFDSHCSLESLVKQTCKSVSYALFKIGRIRQYLDKKSTEEKVHAMITSRLDYCNSSFYNLRESEIRKLQTLQNSAARLVTRRK